MMIILDKAMKFVWGFSVFGYQLSPYWEFSAGEESQVKEERDFNGFIFFNLLYNLLSFVY